MKVVIRENTWFRRDLIEFGWGNGYVLIPKGSPLHGKYYTNIDVNVHGGLTFSKLVNDNMIEEWNLDKKDKGKWCVGFDTGHYPDNLSNWPKNRVKKEAEELKNNLLSLEKELIKNSTNKNE